MRVKGSVEEEGGWALVYVAFRCAVLGGEGEADMVMGLVWSGLVRSL